MSATVLLLGALGVAPGVRADGMLDPSFGKGGLVTTNFLKGSSDDSALSLAVQPDGRAVAAGYTVSFLGNAYMAVARYLTSGALDPTFGDGGQVAIGFEPPVGVDTYATASSVLLQTDGRLVLVGDVQFQGSTPRVFALARLMPDGSLDPSFGTDGRVTTPFSDKVTGSAALLQPDGRIVAVGALTAPPPFPPPPGTIVAARYNADGSLDPTFGVGGQLTLPQFGTLSVRDVALQADGKILIAGSMGENFALVRLLPNGSPDSTFDGDGLVVSDFGLIEEGFSVIALDDGRIVLGGYRSTGSTADFALVRYLPDGSVDTTFGNGGLATGDSGAVDVAERMILLPNGKLLLAGSAHDFEGLDFLLARFQPDGVLDTSFGTAGFLRTGFPGGTMDECHAVAIAGPDLVLTAGVVSFPPTDFGLARYIASTPVQLLGFEVQ